MAFDAEITNAWVGARFYLKVGGLDAIFLDSEIPLGPAGVAWAAPTSKGFSHVYKPNLLDLTAGLTDIGQDILRRSGATSPGQMSITLGPDARDDYLLTLFARDNPDGNTAIINASLGYDVGGAGSVVTTKGLSGWGASGLAYLGRETINYPLINGNDLGQSPGDLCTRDLFSVGDSDVRFILDSNKSTAPRIITDFPTVWHNRVVQMYAYLVDREGRALDTAIDGDNSREIFRGTVQGVPSPDETWSRWTLNCRSIDALTHSEVGKEPTEGRFLKGVGANVDANGNNGDLNGAADVLSMIYITESTNKISFTINSTTTFNETLLAAGAVYHLKDIREAFIGALTTTVQAAGFSNLFFDFGVGVKKLKGRAFIGVGQDEDGGVPSAITVIFHFGEEDSIGKVLGFDGSDKGAYNVTSGVLYQVWATKVNRIALWISPTDEIIPFFFLTNSQVTDSPAEPGYAKVGSEVIKYTAIADNGGDMQGLKTLTGCTRGVFGTQGKEYFIEYDDNGQALGDDPPELQFLQAFDKVSLFDIILQLATSTGENAHHGTSDVLEFAVGPAIPSQHFYLKAIEAVKLDLMAWEHDDLQWWFDKPRKLNDLITKWLQPLGKFLTARTNEDGDYLITVVDVLPPLESEAVHTLDSSNVMVEDPAKWRQGADLIINELSIKWQWNVKEAKFNESAIVCRDLDSIADYGVKGRMSWELHGYKWDYQTAIENAYQWAWSTFKRYGKPYDLMEVQVDRKGWLIQTGDTILITLASVPTTEGEFGFSTRAARVLGTTYRYHVPGGVPGATLLLGLENIVRHSSYSPSAEVVNESGTTLTLDANAFTHPGLSTDVQHFDVGDSVQFFNRGDASTVDVRTIDSKNEGANTIVIDSALVNVTFTAGETHMIPNVYDHPDTQDTQQAHAYCATLTSPSANNEPFKYV